MHDRLTSRSVIKRSRGRNGVTCLKSLRRLPHVLIRPMHTSHHSRNVSRPTSRTRIIAPSYRCSAMHPHASKPFQKTFAKALLVIPRCSSKCHPMRPKRCEAVRLSGNESSVGLMTNQHSCPHVLVTPAFLQRRYHPPDWPTSFLSNTSSMSQLN